MALIYLNADLFHGAVIQACHWIIQQRESLNAINIFPVADGDTGDNMAATATAIINHAPSQSTLPAVCKVIADASILGARGNSGMIFSQFFNGLIEETELPLELNTQQFASLITKASKSVRAAILNPVEGTILTVMDAWAKSLSQHAQSITDFKVLMHEIKKDVQAALQSTSQLLAVLKEAHVVDAGAKGFSLFVQGFAAFLTNPHAYAQPTQAVVFEPAHTHDDLSKCTAQPTHRYCTEAVVMGESLDKDQIKDAVAAFGDSVVLAGNQRLCRLHLHCNDPSQVFQVLQSFGKVRSPKVDDMLRQYQVIHERKYRIALVTDSGVNIPQAVADDYQIHFISLNVHWDNHDLLDKYSFDSNSFYHNLAKLPAYPTTSFPPPAQIEDKIRYLSRHYDDVLVISLAQVLSGTHDAMVQVASRYANVHVINSRHVSGSQGLLLNYAAELIADGLSIEAVKAAVLDKVPKTKFLAMIHQIDSLVRSGRVPKIAGKLVQFAGIKPIISLDEDGRGVLCDKAFSENKALVKLIDLVKGFVDTHGGMENYCILHTGAPEKAREFAILATEAFGHEPAFIEPAATAIGLHAGNGSVALAAMFR
jgi:DegV family protein with EDD domain